MHVFNYLTWSFYNIVLTLLIHMYITTILHFDRFMRIWLCVTRDIFEIYQHTFPFLENILNIFTTSQSNIWNIKLRLQCSSMHSVYIVYNYTKIYMLDCINLFWCKIFIYTYFIRHFYFKTFTGLCIINIDFLIYYLR